MADQYWSWILGAIGITGFYLSGKKIWWSWYINVAVQGLWIFYAFVTEQYGFLLTAPVYAFVFGKNAIQWTKDHDMKKAEQKLWTEANDPIPVVTDEEAGIKIETPEPTLVEFPLPEEETWATIPDHGMVHIPLSMLVDAPASEQLFGPLLHILKLRSKNTNSTFEVWEMRDYHTRTYKFYWDFKSKPNDHSDFWE